MKPLMEGAWAHDPKQRFTIDEVVHRAQTILMNLDSCLFWVPEEDDFLFDVYLATESSDTVSEMGDELEQEDPAMSKSVSSAMDDSDGRPIPTDESSRSEDGTKSGPSRQSSMIAQHCKLVSSAA